MNKNSVSTPSRGSVPEEIRVFRKSGSTRERKLSIVIPTYNEVGNIGALIQCVLEVFQRGGVDGELIVVDDSSPDGTGEIVKDYAQKFENVTLVSRREKNGYGNACKDGIRFTSGRFIMGMDADFSHDPEIILSMY
nr:glycosyltransferase [Candidatus Freyarchaeota archaeon]